MEIEKLLELDAEKLSQRYYLSISGNENHKEINQIFAILCKYIQEIDKVNIYINNKYDEAKNELSLIDDDIDYAEQLHFRDLSRNNKRISKESKLTDKAITAESFIEARPDVLRNNINKLKKDLFYWGSKKTIWASLQKQIYFINETLQTSSTNNSSYLKNFANLKPDIQQKMVLNDSQEIEKEEIETQVQKETLF
jgi:hypothetical protein